MSDLEEFLKSKKILIVDDESFMRSVLSGIVKHLGFYGVSEARDGKSALEMLKAKPFDVCFCDWEMPGMSGIELYEEIKSNEELKNVIFIMITGHTQAEKVQQAIECGIKEYIAKPFNENVIRKKLIKVLSTKKQG